MTALRREPRQMINIAKIYIETRIAAEESRLAKLASKLSIMENLGETTLAAEYANDAKRAQTVIKTLQDVLPYVDY